MSTRRVKKITTKLCGRSFTKSTVSRLTKELDEQVRAWADRPLEGEYPFLIVDAMHIKVRRQGAVQSTSVLLAVGISDEGQREILGLHLALGETKEAWAKFFDRLKDRGLTGVEMVTSDGHQGLRITTFPSTDFEASRPVDTRQASCDFEGRDGRLLQPPVYL